MNEKNRISWEKITERERLEWEIMEGLQGIAFTREKVGLNYISKKVNTMYLLSQYL